MAASTIPEMTRLRYKRGPAEPLSVSLPTLMKSVLIAVGANLIGRGSPKDFAVIYAASPEDFIFQPNTDDDDDDSMATESLDQLCIVLISFKALRIDVTSDPPP